MRIVCRAEGRCTPVPGACACPQPTVVAEGRPCDVCRILTPPLDEWQVGRLQGHRMCVAAFQPRGPHPLDGRR